MGRPANYMIVELEPDVVIRDIGPWNIYLTVTNDAEGVVERIAKSGVLTEGKRLFYWDSENSLDELLVKDGKFAGFA